MFFLKQIQTLSVVLVGLLVWQAAIPPAVAQQQQPTEDNSAAPFHITVLEGEGSINNIRQAVNRGAMVLVEDENKNPMPGAAVTFFLPNEGPSGLFLNGSRVLTVFSDDKGLAASRGIRFNNLVGLMRIRVVASQFSQTSTAMITQTNVSSAAAVKSSYVPATREQKPSGGHFFTKKTLIIAAVAGAGIAAAVYFGTKKTPPSATVSVGTATIGAPK